MGHDNFKEATLSVKFRGHVLSLTPPEVVGQR